MKRIFALYGLLFNLNLPNHSRVIRILRINLASALLFLSSGCAVLVGGAAVTGAMVASDRRTTGTVIEDQAIEVKAYQALHQAGLQQNQRIRVSSYNLVVLLTGEVNAPETRQKAEEIVRQVERVRHVYNELIVAPPILLTQRSQDVTLSAAVNAALLNVTVPGFNPLAVQIVVERGIVYLMGLVRIQEAEAVTEQARYVRGVQQVVRLFEYIE